MTSSQTLIPAGDGSVGTDRSANLRSAANRGRTGAVGASQDESQAFSRRLEEAGERRRSRTEVERDRDEADGPDRPDRSDADDSKVSVGVHQGAEEGVQAAGEGGPDPSAAADRPTRDDEAEDEASGVPGAPSAIVDERPVGAGTVAEGVDAAGASAAASVAPPAVGNVAVGDRGARAEASKTPTLPGVAAASIQGASGIQPGQPSTGTGGEPDPGLDGEALADDGAEVLLDTRADRSVDGRATTTSERGPNGTDALRADAAARTAPVPTDAAATARLAQLNDRAAQALDQIRVAIHPGMRRISIALTPIDLGRVDVRIALEGDGLVAHLRVEAPETYQALERHLPELRASLERAGLDVTRLDVSQDAPDPNGRRDGSDGGRSEARARTNASDADEHTTASVWFRPNTLTDRSVDTLA
ncbi:Flagellar hook-length control protein FliK [Planctomycetes bacterium Pla163]|uniref:Flagellar hook-length control protein FliK n=1 Tax=Rohdeia mirabilis TaxID=2528008 RepID=A0A518D519_9BACT|nr:Flagellar hook-length control protein FliK [Planctomycetes bacterium Pla163]